MNLPTDALTVRITRLSSAASVLFTSEVDVLVSWNFKHIVRLDKIRLFNAVNFEGGYKALAIYSPREVAGHEGD